jgi:hypothetical protein
MEPWLIHILWPLLAPVLVAIGYDVNKRYDFAFRITSASKRSRIKNLERRLAGFEDLNSLIGELLVRFFVALFAAMAGVGILFSTMVIQEMRCEVKVECIPKAGYDITLMIVFMFFGVAFWEIQQLRYLGHNKDLYRDKLRARIADLRARLENDR